MVVTPKNFENRKDVFIKFTRNVCVQHSFVVIHEVIWPTWVDWGDLEVVVNLWFVFMCR